MLLDFDSMDNGYGSSLWVPGSQYSLDTSIKKTGVASMRPQSGANEVLRDVPPHGEGIMGVSVYLLGNDGFSTLWLMGDSGAVRHLGMYVDPVSSKWKIVRAPTASTSGGTQLGLDTPGPMVAFGKWYTVEFHYIIHDTTGVFDVWVDNRQVFAFVGDTRNGGVSTNIDRLGFKGQSSTIYTYFDDYYLLDTTGAVNNSRLGDVDVVALKPNGNGASSQFVGSDGNSTDNYLLVDDTPTVNTADYVASTTPGAKDTYALANVPANAASVCAVRASYHGLKAANGIADIKALTIADGATKTDTAKPLSTISDGYEGAVQNLTPAGNPWTLAHLNGAEAGVEVA